MPGHDDRVLPPGTYLVTVACVDRHQAGGRPVIRLGLRLPGDFNLGALVFPRRPGARRVAALLGMEAPPRDLARADWESSVGRKVVIDVSTACAVGPDGVERRFNRVEVTGVWE